MPRQERLSAPAYQRMLAFVERGHEVGCLDDLPRFIVSALPAVVPCDSISYNEVDPAHKRLVSLLEPATLRFEGDAELLASLMQEHPLIDCYRRTRDGRAVKISDFLSESAFRALDLYRLVYLRLDTNYQISVTLPAPEPLIVGIALNRKRRDFTERERLMLNLLRPHLEHLHYRLEAADERARAMGALGRALDATSQGVLVLRRSGDIDVANDRAGRLLERFTGEAVRPDGPPPSPLRDWLAGQRRGLGGGIDGSAPSEPLILREGDGRVVCRFLPGVRPDDRDVVLLDEDARRFTSDARGSLGLTPRELEVLSMVADGRTNAQIATTLVISERTVQKHLEHIFKKLRVSTRTGAVALMIAAATYAGACLPPP